MLVPAERGVGFRAYDGSSAGPVNADVVLEVRSPRAVAYLASAPTQLGLARAYVTGDLGFDACVDYKAGSLYADLKAAAQKEIDVCFENVGGEILDTVLRLMSPFSRITVCGLVSQYNLTEPYAMKSLHSILVNRIRMQGFIVSDRMELWPRAIGELAGWLKAGRLRYRESVAQGLEAAPAAFIGMLKGQNFGKQLVKLI